MDIPDLETLITAVGQEWHCTLGSNIKTKLLQELGAYKALRDSMSSPIYLCHKCRSVTPPPAPFKMYVQCICGALTAATAALVGTDEYNYARGHANGKLVGREEAIADAEKKSSDYLLPDEGNVRKEFERQLLESNEYSLKNLARHTNDSYYDWKLDAEWNGFKRGYEKGFDDGGVDEILSHSEARRKMMSVVEAVANIGVDFGFGAYEIQPETIELARDLCTIPSEKGKPYDPDFEPLPPKNELLLKNITDSQVNAVARSFWRRIYPYRDKFERELPESLPVEFLAHMATALTWVDGKQKLDGDDFKDSVMDALCDALGDAYDCSRTWSAWSYGTMTQNDFHLVRDSADRIGEIADAVIECIAGGSGNAK